MHFDHFESFAQLISSCIQQLWTLKKCSNVLTAMSSELPGFAGA